MPLINDYAMRGSSSKINGVLGTYNISEGDTINKGDFVGINIEKVENSTLDALVLSADTSDNRAYDGYLKAVRLTNSDTVLTFYVTNSIIYCSLCTIDNTNTIINSITRIATYPTGGLVDAIQCSDNSVLLVYSNVKPQYKYLYIAARILTLNSEGAISSSTETILTRLDSYTRESISSTISSLGSNKFLLNYRIYTTKTLNSCILTLSESDILVSTPVTQYISEDTISHTHDTIRSTKINDHLVLVLSKTTSMYPILLDIQYDTITTLYTTTILSDLVLGTELDMILLDNNKVFVTYAVSSDIDKYAHINCAILGIEDNQISLLNSINCDTIFPYKYNISINCRSISEDTICVSFNDTTRIASFIVQVDTSNNRLIIKDAIDYYKPDKLYDYNAGLSSAKGLDISDRLDSIIVSSNRLLLFHLYSTQYTDSSGNSVDTYVPKYLLYQLENLSTITASSSLSTSTILGIANNINNTNIDVWLPPIIYEKYNTNIGTNLVYSKFLTNISANPEQCYLYKNMDISGNSIILSSPSAYNSIKDTISEDNIYYSTYPTITKGTTSSSIPSTVTCTVAFAVSSTTDRLVSAYLYGRIIEILDDCKVKGEYIEDVIEPLPALYEYPENGLYKDGYWYVLKTTNN